MDVFFLPHWLGLVDVVGVLLALGVWFLLTDLRRWRIRATVVVGGAVLLIAQLGVEMSRSSFLLAELAAPGQFGRDSTIGMVAALVLGLLAGLFAATLGAGPDEVPVEDVDEPAATPEREAPIYPERVWSRTEVLGHDEDDAPSRVGALLDRVSDPGMPVEVRRPSRGVAVPFLAVALALALPISGFGSVPPGEFAAVHAHVSAYHLLNHLLDGLLTGLALAAVALALDVWERWFVGAVFAVVALGELLGVMLPRPFANDYWVAAATGLAAGLAAPAAVRALRRVGPPGRFTALLGAAAGLVLLALRAWASVKGTIDLSGGF